MVVIFANDKEVWVDEFIVKVISGASLVAQWQRILLPRQGTRILSLVWEDPTCLGAAEPRATATEPVL